MTATAETGTTAMAAASQNGHAARPPTPLIKVTGLSDLEAITGEIELVRPDGAVLSVPYRALTQAELMAERNRVKWPEPPKQMVQGAKGSRPQLVENREDPAFLAAATVAAEEFGYRLVARCLAGGGVEIPGDTPEEQVAAVRASLGAWAFTALAQAFQSIHNVTDADIRVASKN